MGGGREGGEKEREAGEERDCVVERVWLLHLAECELLAEVYLQGLGQSKALDRSQR